MPITWSVLLNFGFANISKYWGQKLETYTYTEMLK